VGGCIDIRNGFSLRGDVFHYLVIHYAHRSRTVGVEVRIYYADGVALYLPFLWKVGRFIGRVDWAPARATKVVVVLLIVIATPCLVLHPTTRLLIAIHSIVLLRNLPDTTYLVLLWSDAIPSLYPATSSLLQYFLCCRLVILRS